MRSPLTGQDVGGIGASQLLPFIEQTRVDLTHHVADPLRDLDDLVGEDRRRYALA